MLTREEAHALLLLAALLAAGTLVRVLDARHPRLLHLTLGDSLALGALPGADTPSPAGTGAPPPAAGGALPPASHGAAGDAPKTQPAYRLDGRLEVNRATAEDLERLPGIGPTTAARILDHRRAHGPFRRPEDLLGVRGIGRKTLARFADRLAFGAPRDSAGDR